MSNKSIIADTLYFLNEVKNETWPRNHRGVVMKCLNLICTCPAPLVIMVKHPGFQSGVGLCVCVCARVRAYALISECVWDIPDLWLTCELSESHLSCCFQSWEFRVTQINIHMCVRAWECQWMFMDAHRGLCGVFACIYVTTCLLCDTSGKRGSVQWAFKELRWETAIDSVFF